MIRLMLFGRNLNITGFFSAKCTEDTAAYQKFFGEDRVVNLLTGLSYEYDQVRARLIGQIPFPSLQKAHA